jgi:predicted ATP-grasp superfamily ATP-dependent carboligase
MAGAPTITSKRIDGPAAAGPPDNYDVLILDAGSRQSLAAARSLGRAGLRVALGECFAECDPDLPALAFRSRYSARNVVLPNFKIDAGAFSGGVVDFVRHHPTRVVLPTADGAIAALLPRRAELAALGCTLALAPDPILEIANNKDRTLKIALELGIAYPKTLQIDTPDQLPAALAELGFPVVLKPNRSWGTVVRLASEEAINEAEAERIAQHFFEGNTSVLAQQWVGGRREGVTMFISDGNVRAVCAHVAHRTSPAIGGASVMRESLPVPADIYDSAVRLVKAMGLEGTCEVEFRRDLDNRPFLMEVNARLAGTIENAVRSGVDFPLMLWRWAAGLPVESVDGYKTGVRTRWLRGDLRWLRDNHGRAGRPDSVSRSRALRTFAMEFARTVHYDTLDVHDLGPAWAELRNTTAAIRRSL